jgi:N-acetylneuraminic acid mutarotase
VSGQWKVLAPLPGGPRQEVAVVALNGRIYVMGGLDGINQPTNVVEVYDPATDTWATAQPLPRPMHHINAAGVNGRIYVLGALITTAFLPLGEVYAYNPLVDIWEAKTPMPDGTQRGASGVAVVGSRIHVVGGFRGGTVADVSVYDTALDEWTELPKLPAASDHLVAAAVGDAVYAMGGRVSGQLRGRVDVFAPSLNQWLPRKEMLTARAGAAVGVLDGKIHVLGGEGNDAAATGVFPQHEVYDPVADAWAALSPMATPRHGTAAAVVSGSLYLPGGATLEGIGPVALHEVYTPNVQ